MLRFWTCEAHFESIVRRKVHFNIQFLAYFLKYFELRCQVVNRLDIRN